MLFEYNKVSLEEIFSDNITISIAPSNLSVHVVDMNTKTYSKLLSVSKVLEYIIGQYVVYLDDINEFEMLSQILDSRISLDQFVAGWCQTIATKDNHVTFYYNKEFRDISEMKPMSEAPCFIRTMKNNYMILQQNHSIYKTRYLFLNEYLICMNKTYADPLVQSLKLEQIDANMYKFNNKHCIVSIDITKAMESIDG